MVSVTRLGLYGGPGLPYGSFAGKGGSPPLDTDQVTRLGLYGGPSGLYGSFAGKAPSLPPVDTDQVTRLGLYGGPQGLYGSFEGKAEAPIEPEAAAEIVGGGWFAGPRLGERRLRDERDLLDILMIWTSNSWRH